MMQRVFHSPVMRLMRPHQWSKNAVVLAGVVFSGQAGDPSQLLRAIVATLGFCLASSAVYVFNDWHDRAEDQRHPTKCRRPVAAGDVSPGMARILSVALSLAAVIVTLLVSPALAGIILLYLAMMTVYTVWIRRFAFVDVVVIAIGFVLRALAGAVAVAVPLSVWLFACTFLLAVFLGLGKRRHELRMLHGHTERHRPSLAGYARINLDHAIVAVAVLTCAAYVFYAFAVPTFGRVLPMFLTVPFVVIAIGRYLYLVLRRNLGGSPEVLLFRDRSLLASIIAWSASVALVLVS